MRTVVIQPLSVTDFFEFGFYRNMFDPVCEKLGAPPIEFFRDMLPQTLGQATLVSYSNCRVEPREMLVDATECHSRTAEMLLPLDADVLMHFAPATPPTEPVPLDKIRVFRIPRGTMVVIKPGTWHHAPFVIDGNCANVLVALPERTYASDCTAVRLIGDDRVRILVS